MTPVSVAWVSVGFGNAQYEAETMETANSADRTMLIAIAVVLLGGATAPAQAPPVEPPRMGRVIILGGVEITEDNVIRKKPTQPTSVIADIVFLNNHTVSTEELEKLV